MKYVACYKSEKIMNLVDICVIEIIIEPMITDSGKWLSKIKTNYEGSKTIIGSEEFVKKHNVGYSWLT